MRKRIIKYKPLPSQQRFHTSPKRYRGFSGPVGSGKSLALVQEIIRMAYQNPGLMGIVAAPTYGMLRSVTRRALLEVLDENFVPYRSGVNMITLADCRSQILFRSADDPETLRGSNLAWFAVDELTYCPADTWSRLQGRLRDPKASHLSGIAAWTPRGFDDTYKRFIETPDTFTEAIIAAPFENVYLGIDYYNSLKAGYDEHLYRQEVLGEYLAIGQGRAYHAFDEQSIADLKYEPTLPLYWAVDFNVGMFCTLVMQQVADEFRVIKELVVKNTNTEQMCQHFMDWLSTLPGRPSKVSVKIYGDASGNSRKTSAAKTDYEVIRGFFNAQSSVICQLDIPSSNPHVKDRINSVNASLRAADGTRRLYINRDARELVIDLRQVSWKPDVFELDKTDPARTHCSDALGYCIHRISPVSSFRREIVRP